MAPPLTRDQTGAVAAACRALAKRGHLAMWQVRALGRALADRGLLDDDPELLAALDEGDRRLLSKAGGTMTPDHGDLWDEFDALGYDPDLIHREAERNRAVNQAEAQGRPRVELLFWWLRENVDARLEFIDQCRAAGLPDSMIGALLRLPE